MQTFFFYDLETSGLSSRHDRIMQFAGQRTDMDLNPIGDPYNVLIKLNDDTLPSPDAVLVTGITPQATQSDGLTEAEFAKFFVEEICTEQTIILGYNTIRFDDEFMRHLLWRNFYDPYEWSYKDGRSRWDMLDVVRMMRALRPSGMNWPVDKEGKATNRLELLTKANNIEHKGAHDALSDVRALIEVTKLIKTNQPQLFDYLLSIRDKKSIQKIVNLDDKKPFVYTSGRYDAAYNKTTVAFPLTSAPHSNVVVYDLRYDPTQFLNLSTKQLAAKLFASWEERKQEDFQALPVKALQYNRAPAIAPLGVLEQQDSWQTIDLDKTTVEKHMKILLANPTFAENIRTLFEQKKDKFEKSETGKDPEAQLYDGFTAQVDKLRIEAVRNASPEQLADFQPDFKDERLPGLLLHYKARNYPDTLSEDEVGLWENWRTEHLNAQLPGFMSSLKRLATARVKQEQEFLLQELQLWAESILPTIDQ